MSGVIGGPLVGRLQVGAQRVLAPLDFGGGDDRREGRDRAVFSGVFQADDQRAEPAHGVAGDRLARRVDRKVFGDELGQFVDDIRVHLIMLGPGLGGGVDVESGALSKVPAIRCIVDFIAARAGVGCNDRHAQLRGQALKAALFGDVLPGAGQSRQKIEHRVRAVARGQEDGKLHRDAAGAGGVFDDFLATAKALPIRNNRNRHVKTPYVAGDEVDAGGLLRMWLRDATAAWIILGQGAYLFHRNSAKKNGDNLAWFSGTYRAILLVIDASGPSDTTKDMTMNQSLNGVVRARVHLEYCR